MGRVCGCVGMESIASESLSVCSVGFVEGSCGMAGGTDGFGRGCMDGFGTDGVAGGFAYCSGRLV